MPESVLLHTCCAPCLSQCLMVLTGQDEWEGVLNENPSFSFVVYFDNPNIQPNSEYDKRKEALKKLMLDFPAIPTLQDNSESRRSGWNDMAQMMANEPERGKRCAFCYEYRLEETFRRARDWNFQAVATTLTLSPMKDAKLINEIGARLARQYKMEYIYSDFKKNDGFKKSIQLSEKYGLYRQNFCGCGYSVR